MKVNLDEQKPSKVTSSQTKAAIILRALQRKRGVTLDELCALTGWQRHSMRGHLSGTLRRKQQMNIITFVSKKGVRRYHLSDDACESAS